MLLPLSQSIPSNVALFFNKNHILSEFVVARIRIVDKSGLCTDLRPAMDGFSTSWRVGSTPSCAIIAQVYPYNLAALTTHWRGEDCFLLFRLMFMAYHVVKNLDVVEKEIHMSVPDIKVIILQTGIDVTGISSRHYRETPNTHKQHHRFRLHVEANTTL